MAQSAAIAMTTALICFTLVLLGPATCSTTGRVCCTRYTRTPVPFRLIKGYREQTMMENCHIEAILFFTVKKNTICATRRDEWVRKTLEQLSLKLKKMSKARSAAGGGLKKTERSDGGGALLGTTETFLSTTESFY